MRTFKFRIWHKIFKEMFYPQGPTKNEEYEEMIYLQLDGVLMGDFRGIGLVDCSDDYVVQQFTGLKDSKGVEIYEGDIVKGLFLDTDARYWEEATAPVVWVDRVGGFNLSSDTWDRLSIEVVGNIFENENI